MINADADVYADADADVKFDGAILAVDYGLRCCGLAVCDTERRLAVGIGVLTGLAGRALTRAVKREAELRRINEIVVGLPCASGASGCAAAAGAERLSQALGKSGMIVHRWNEAYSTAEALSAKRHYGNSHNKPRGWEDEAAAVLILQNYLDWLKNKQEKS